MVDRWIRVAMLWGCFLFTAALTAQEAEPKPETRETPTAEAAKPTPRISRATTIYIPYAKLKQLFEKEGRGVFVPYEKFQELMKAAQQAAEKIPEIKPPVGALITSIRSEAQIGKEVVVVTATLRGELLTPGWHRIPLRLADCSILSATIKGKPARLVSDDSGFALWLEKKDKPAEPWELQLTYSKAFQKSPGNNSVGFQAPQAAINEWTVRINEPGIKINLTPAASDSGPEPEKEKLAQDTVVRSHVGNAAEVKIDWTPKAEGAAGLEAIVAVQTKQEILIEEGVVRSRVVLKYDITRAELAQLSLRLPPESQWKILNVFDANVRKWKVDKTDEKQQVVIDLHQPAKGTQGLILELEQTRQTIEGTTNIPEVVAENVVRQFGTVAVRVAGTLRAEVLERGGLSQLDAADTVAELGNQQWTYAYRFAAVPYKLGLHVSMLQPRLEAQQFVELFLEPQRLSLDVTALVKVEQAGIFGIDVTIPEGFEVLEVVGRTLGEYTPPRLEGRPRVGKGENVVRVQFAAKEIGPKAFLLRLQKPLTEAGLLTPTGEISLPRLELPRVKHEALESLQGHAVLYTSEALRLETKELAGLRAEPPHVALATGFSSRQERFPGLRETAAFSFGDEPTSLVCVVERRKPVVTARQIVTATVETGLAKFQSSMLYEIRYSGIKSLRVEVPTALVDKLQLLEPQLRKSVLQPKPEDVPADYTAWEIRGDGELFGNVTMTWEWTENLPDFQLGKSRPLFIPRLIPGGDASTNSPLQRSWGQIAISKADTIDIAEQESAGLQPIDPRIDFLDRERFPRATRAYEFHDAWHLTMNVTRYELEEVKRTSIDRAYARVIATRGGQLAVHVLYRLKTARQRVAIALPPGADAATAFDSQPLHVNGKATPLEKDGANFYIPLGGSATETPLLIELRYTLAGDVARIDLPSFPEDPAVQKLYLATYLPREQTVIGALGPWSDEMPWEPPPLLKLLGVESPPRDEMTDPQLIAWVSEGIGMQSSAETRMSLDGVPHLFSTLRPIAEASPAISPTTPTTLRLWSVRRTTLHGIVFCVVVLAGVLLAWRPLSDRLAFLGLLAAIVFVLANFQPTLGGAILSSSLIGGVALVILVWLVRGAIFLATRSAASPPISFNDAPPAEEVSV